MDPDTVLWGAIGLMTAHMSVIDTSVIHGRYTLDAKEKLNILLHQFVILSIMLGIFFQARSNIQLHLFGVIMCMTCWYWFDGCFMAKWQRDNIVYTKEDFAIIQKPKKKRLFEFLSIVIPMVLVDLYKLS